MRTFAALALSIFSIICCVSFNVCPAPAADDETNEGSPVGLLKGQRPAATYFNMDDDPVVVSEIAVGDLETDVAMTNPIVKSGLKMRIVGRKIVIGAGRCEIDGQIVDLPQPTKVTVPPAGVLTVKDEPVKFVDDSGKPSDTVVLGKCRAANVDQTILRNVLVGNSVKLTTNPAGGVKPLFADIDFTVDTKFGAVTRTPTGGIKPQSKAWATYQCWRRRIDTIALDPAAKHFVLLQGVPARSAPEPPAVPTGMIPLATVISDWGDKDIMNGNLMAIENANFPFDPKLVAHNRRAMAPVIKKLEDGATVNIAFWGDSVTLGYDARTKDACFANQFVKQLQEKYPKATIVGHNLGIGSTNSFTRLGRLPIEVFGLKPLPDLVVVEFVNDFSLTSHALSRDYEELLDEAKHFGARVILCTPHCPNPRMARAANWDAVADKPYITVLHELVRNNDDVALADVFSHWQHLPREGLRAELLLVNGLNHPNNKGHAMYTEELMRCFGPVDKVATTPVPGSQ